MSQDQLAALIRQIVDDVPPLTPEQRADLRHLLRPTAQPASAAEPRRAT